MFNAKNYEYDCTRNCRLRSHGNEITAALTKRSMADDKLAAYIAKSCCNFADIVDDLGRSAVHLAASVDRYAILEWLLNQGAIINGRDFESGSSVLHRAIYYGCIDCAVLLLRYGASMELLDEDTRCALQNVCRMRDFAEKATVPSNNEILVWGSNKNYNLGIGNEEGTLTPQSIDYFRKEHISIESVALGTYHSLFLDKKSHLYAVGHGKGGRLGIGVENSLPAPKRVKLPIKNASEHIIGISTSRKHSLLLTNRSIVYACGINEDQQLGVRDAGEKLTVFKEVVTLRDFGVTGLLRVIARDFYSLAYAEDCIYAWGTNQGQLGLPMTVRQVPLPKQLKLPPATRIQFVEANNYAVAVYTKDNQIILYYNAKMKSLKTPNYEVLKSICIVGGDNTKSVKGTVTALKLLMLTQTNVIYLWYEMTQSFYRCIFATLRITQIDKIFYKANQVFIMSQGDVYKGKCQQIAVNANVDDVPSTNSPSTKRAADANSIWSRCDQSRTAVSKEHMIRIDLQRLASVDRAVDIYCDDDFTSFAVLQESSMKYFKLPTLMAEQYAFKKLYNDANPYDAVHDVVFVVQHETFAAHKFIIYSRAPGLRTVIDVVTQKEISLNYPHLTGKMFELLLKYIYTNQLPNDEDLDVIQQSLSPTFIGNRLKVCQLLADYADKFQLQDLSTYLKSFLSLRPFQLPQQPDKSKYRFNRLRRTDLPALYDVRIICAGDIELPAHKCMLVATLEYFDMMFTHSWAEQTTINLSTVPIEYMQPIVEFLYSSDVEQFRKQQHSETYLYNMIVYCDQFFIERLRKVCEILILDKVTIRKCGDMLQFASMYNCEVLKQGCLEFICQNMARVLAYKSLDCCEPEALKCINNHYRRMFKQVFDYRMITPDAEAIDDDLLLSFVDDFQVNLDYRMDEHEDATQNSAATKQKTPVSKHSTRHYELEAISSMMDTMHVNEQKKTSPESETKTLNETKEIAQKLQAESKSWMKVVDKKDQKKKLEPSAVKLNELLKTDDEPLSPEYVPLSATKSFEKSHVTPEKEIASEPMEVLPPKVYNLNLADFKSPREKLSQKQRKRLSSESWRAPRVESSPVVAQPAPQPNAWGVVSSNGGGGDSIIFEPPATGSAADSTSFANMMRVPTSTTPPAAAGGRGAESKQSFTRILAEEKKQRDYYERMRTKSLALTQIEETAIAELREFYNADRIDDEIITVARKALPRTMNFAIWQRN